MLKKVFDVDPLLCARCHVQMKVISWIPDPNAIGRIVEHRRKARLESSFDARGRFEVREPPAA